MAFPYRSISLCASLLSALLNIVCALRILLSWRSLRWDFSGVDDTDTLPVNIDALHLLWGLLTLYFAAAATASTIGFVGIARNLVTYVRFFRDYSIAEFLFMLLSATFISYLSFSPSSSSLRTSVCDELGRQPELLRDVAESGLDLENCEYWFERGVIVVIAMLLVFVIVRVHFIIALSKYYNQLRRKALGYPTWYTASAHDYAQATPMQRIYLLPTPTSPEYTAMHQFSRAEKDVEKGGAVDVEEDDLVSESEDGVILYAPVPVGRVSRDEAKGMGLQEAWMSPTPATPRAKKHHRHHSHSHVRHAHASGSRANSGAHRHHRSMDVSASVHAAEGPRI